MNILERLYTILSEIAPTQTGLYSDPTPDTFIEIVPMSENFVIYADDKPVGETSSVRIALYTKGNYIALKNQIIDEVLLAGLTITDRTFIEHEKDTGYYHYSIDVMEYKEFQIKQNQKE